jgi:hypothetical protein
MACQLDLDGDGWASRFPPMPDPRYPLNATNWLVMGTDPNDFDPAIVP